MSEIVAPRVQARSGTVFFTEVVLLSFCVLSMAAFALAGPIPTTFFSSETLIWTDAAWKMLQGQVPSADFYSPLGLLWMYPLYASMRLVGPVAEALPLAQAMGGAIIVLGGHVVARRHLSTGLLVAFTLVQLSLCISPSREPGEWMMLGHAAMYNRWTASVLCILAVTAFAPCRSVKRRAWLWTAVSQGFLVAILFFIKASAALIGFGILAAGMLLDAGSIRQAFRYALAVIAAFALGCLVVVGALHADVVAYARDLLMAGRTRQLLGPLGIVTAAGRALVLSGLVSLAILAICVTRQPGWRMVRDAVIIVGTAAIAELLFGLTSSGVLGTVMSAAFALTIMERAGPHPFTGDLRVRFAAGVSVLNACLLVLLPNVAGLGYGMVLWIAAGNGALPLGRFDAAPLSGLAVYRDDERTTVNTNSGLTLLREHTKPSDTIHALDYYNPFNFALRMPSPRGVALWHHAGVNFDARSSPSPAQLLGESCWIMIPKNPGAKRTVTLLREMVQPVLHARYTLDAESATWWLWRSRTAC